MVERQYMIPYLDILNKLGTILCFDQRVPHKTFIRNQHLEPILGLLRNVVGNCPAPSGELE